MDSDKNPSDLVAEIEADEASRRTAPSDLPKKPSLLGRPVVMAVSLIVFAVSAAWGYESARHLLVRARTAVEAYRAEKGSLPDRLAAAMGDVAATPFGYVAASDNYVVGLFVGDELVWLESGDDVARFLEDGSHVPAAPAAPPS